MPAAEVSLDHHGAQIASLFGLGTPSRPMVPAARGKQGIMWRLDTETDAYAVKELVLRTTAAEVAQDTAFQEAMARRDGLFLPRPIRTVDGEVLAHVGDHQVRVYEWVGLLPPRVDLAPTLLGELLAALHRDPLPAAGPVHPWYVAPVELAEWDAMAAALHARGAPFAAEFTAAIPAQVEGQRLLTAPVQLQLCHCDLWADNLLPTPDGRVCVIDWENCGAQDPGHELAMLLFEFCYQAPGRVARLWTAYRDAGGTGRLDGRGSFTMVIAQLGHFMQAAGEDWLEAGTDDDRDRAEAWFREAIERPLDAAQMDELLGVTG